MTNNLGAAFRPDERSRLIYKTFTNIFTSEDRAVNSEGRETTSVRSVTVTTAADAAGRASTLLYH